MLIKHIHSLRGDPHIIEQIRHTETGKEDVKLFLQMVHLDI